MSASAVEPGKPPREWCQSPPSDTSQRAARSFGSWRPAAL